MKKTAIILFLFLAGKIFSQENIYQQLINQAKLSHPELKFENRLLVVNVWSVADLNSRETNIQLDKAYTAYEYAKLKGGLKGMIALIICKDAEGNSQTIALNKDKITKSISIQLNTELDFNNMIFNSNGEVVQKNVSGDLFAEINKLITR